MIAFNALAPKAGPKVDPETKNMIEQQIGPCKGMIDDDQVLKSLGSLDFNIFRDAQCRTTLNEHSRVSGTGLWDDQYGPRAILREKQKHT